MTGNQTNKPRSQAKRVGLMFLCLAGVVVCGVTISVINYNAPGSNVVNGVSGALVDVTVGKGEDDPETVTALKQSIEQDEKLLKRMEENEW